MLQDELILFGKKTALAEFRSRAERQCEAADVDAMMEEAKDVFTKTVVTEAKRRGFIEPDAYFYAFNGWDRCKGEFIKECRHELSLIQKEHAVNQVRSVQVECTIEPKIREAALPYCIVYQKYRIKVCVRIDYNRHLEFYVRYRDFNNERIIDGITEMILSNVRYIQDYGPQLSLRDNHVEMEWTYPENYRLEL